MGVSPPGQRPGCAAALRAVPLLRVPVFVLALVGCAPDTPAPSDASSVERELSGSVENRATPIFVDVGPEVGIDFLHFNGAAGDLRFPEIVGSGAAWFDADRDGDLDLFLVQGAPWEDRTPEQSLFPPPAGAELRDRIYRNDLQVHGDGSRTPRFVDVTSEAGIDGREMGTGVAVGDFDGDGWDDLYVTGVESNRLWRNRGTEEGGAFPVFEDVTQATGTDDPRWSTSAAWLDADGDGDLDLFVTNYVDFRLSNPRVCRQPNGKPDYCGPASYRPLTDRLWLNPGTVGPFEDVSARWGLTAKAGAGLGVVAADFDEDGRVDVYVANDQMPNFLWKNGLEGGAPFLRDDSAFSGAAVGIDGRPEASMGVDAGDLDEDGDLDLLMTHLDGETNTLYVNQGRGLFLDRSDRSRLGNPSLGYTGFGVVLADVDSDGWLDALVANGAVKVDPDLVLEGDPYPFGQENQLFRNTGVGSDTPTFDEVPIERAGETFGLLETSRGVAVGDVDEDGDPDVLVTNVAGPARLLENRTDPAPDRWIGLRLTTGPSATDAIGARVIVETSEGRLRHRRVRRDGSFLSSHDPRILIGLGEPATEVRRVEVQWPDGEAEVWGPLEAGRYHRLHRGQGAAEGPRPEEGT